MEEEKATSGEAQAPADDTSGMLKELFGSDSEGDDQNGELNKQTSDVDMKELFGSDDEDIVGEGAPKQQEGEQGGGVAAVAADKEEAEEEGGTRDEVGPMHIDVELRDALPLSQLRVAKLPNSLRIEPDAFEREDFKGDDFNGPVIRKVQGKFLFNPIGISRADRPKVRPRDGGGPKVKVKQTATLVDPVKEREMKEKMEEARIKDKEKLQEKQNYEALDYAGKIPPRRQSYLSAAFLEEDDDMPHEGLRTLRMCKMCLMKIRRNGGAARLEEIKKGNDMPKLEDKEPAEPVEESDEEMNVQPKKRRAVVMESDSE
eukprot:jgi/Picre1/29516/NNA_004902.t1